MADDRGNRMRSMGCLLGSTGIFLVLAACAQSLTSGSRTTPPMAAPPPPLAPPPATADTASAMRAPSAQIFPGTGRLVGPRTSAQPPMNRATLGNGGITLSFVNADVRDVAKAVLGEYLNLNYAVAANAQGMMTIETSRPLARADVLPLFEQALRLSGLALVAKTGVYRIVPSADAPHEASINPFANNPGENQAGFSVEIITMKFISATEMARILTPLSPPQGILQTDPVRNLLIIEGTEHERAAMRDTIALFDVDWLAGMSFALYTPQYTDAQGLARELTQIVGGPSSPIAGVVRLVPIERLNAVLAISPQVRYLEELQHWVETLDHPGQGTDKRIFVYYVQNGRATDLAAVLARVLSSSSSRPNGPTPVGQRDEAQGFSPPPGPSPAPELAPPPILGPLVSPAPGMTAGGIANINVTADERNNALVIMSSPQDYGAVQAALRQLDIEPLQVLLEAAIAEVTLTNDLQYGVQYFYMPSDDHQIVLSNSNTSLIAPTFPGFSYLFSQGTNIKVVLDTLSTVTHVEVISSPTVLVLNNQVATLQVGDQVPIITQQAISTITTGAPLVNNVQYHDTGVILKVTPRVNQGGMVMMDISQEVSSVAATTTSSINSPTIKQRKIDSTVAVRDNETIALGGLIMDNTTRQKSGIPFLSDIPVVGALFGTHDTNVVKTELMVLITPHVVDST